MSPQQTNEFSYIFREGYDYRSYLEKKSHFDRIEIAVDSGIRKLVASNEALAQSQIQATNKLGAEVRGGFEGMSVSLDAVDRSIEDLRSVCEHGFARIDLSLNYIDQSIQQLVRIAKTPDQTWALEQYSIAKDAFRKNLVEEALDYVNRAISGYGGRSGYRLEHRFYVLRGLIRLGNYTNFSPDVVDLDAATADFLLAAKYAEHDNPKECARSFGLAGWASYCNGQMADAEKYLKRSIEINPDDNQSRFELSKVLFHTNDTSEALTHFAITIRRDWKYGLRAGSDDDFLRHRKNLKIEIDKYVAEITAELSNFLRDFDQLGIQSKKSILTRHGIEVDRFEVNFFENMRAALKNSPISDLVNLKATADKRLNSLKANLDSAKARLRANIESLREQKQPAKADPGFDPLDKGVLSYLINYPMSAILLICLIALGFAINVILGVILVIASPLVLQFVTEPIVRSFSDSAEARKNEAAASELERDLAQL